MHNVPAIVQGAEEGSNSIHPPLLRRKARLEVSEVQAGLLLEYCFHEIAPFAYNQGVEDAQRYLIRLAEDLPGICFQEPLTYWDEQDGSHSVHRKP